MTLQADIANAYENLPIYDKSAEPAYDALTHEILEQYVMLTTLVNVEFTSVDPYKSSAEMFADVNGGHLAVYSGESDHPYFGNGINVMFRAVHDYFGHYLGRNQFGPKGEEKAWRQHSEMFTPLAQKALTTETRGQNHWVNYGPYSHLPVNERPFAVQKVALLPEEYTTYV